MKVGHFKLFALCPLIENIVFFFLDVKVYGDADVFSGVFCLSQAPNVSLTSYSSYFDPITVAVTTTNFSSSVIISSNNSFLHCPVSGNGDCRFNFQIYATPMLQGPLFCLLIASINLQPCFVYPQLGKFFVQVIFLSKKKRNGNISNIYL